MFKLSTVVITFNEEDNIKDCLESVKWCDEIIIVDSNSTDNTVKIAREYTDNILQVSNKSFADKRNSGIEIAKSNWILVLDADERLSTRLSKELLDLTDTNSDYDAYYINRISFFINKFIKHCGWYPDYILRLFRRESRIRYNFKKVHEEAIYKGKKGRLKNEIIHYTDRDFEHYISKLNLYTDLSASELKVTGNNSSVLDIIFRPALTFLKMYFLKLGILDGYTGLILCLLSSIHVFSKYSKLYYLNHGAK